MSFSLRPFTPPDFTQEKFQNAPNAVLVPCPKDGVAPEHYHAMSIFPEYFKVEGQWIMAKESRMDCVPMPGPLCFVERKRFPSRAGGFRQGLSTVMAMREVPVWRI